MAYLGKNPVDFNDVTEAQTFNVTDGLTVTGEILAGTDSGDAFNAHSKLRVQKADHAYLQIKSANSKQAGILLGDTDDDFVGGMIYDNSTNHLQFNSGDAERMRIDSSGNVGIGETTPAAQVHIKGSDTTNQVIIENTDDGSGAAPDLTLRRTSASPADDDGCGEINFQSLNDNSENLTMGTIRALVTDVSDGTEDGAIVFRTRKDGSLGERMRIDGANVGIGTTAPAATLTIQKDEAGSSTSSSGTTLRLNGNAGSGNAWEIFRESGTSGDLVFANDASGTRVEALRLDLATGDVTTTGSSTFSRANAGFTARSGDSFAITRVAGTVLEINRSNDGTLVDFRSATVAEGNISVSGSTVSYNGGHLSRWSQLTDGTKDTSIVKGTVMTNLDQMAVWSHDAVAATYYVDGDELPEGVSVGDEKTPAVDAFTEDNEQLNCMAVSSVEGDTNVAGVFVNWDNDDDDFNDMNVAMTGDMVIRIAQGTTVARGDLLMSAGDGTAKPQGDDIVRSKTIAKVTSTNVSHTYDDGSYLVPCVLMAC